MIASLFSYCLYCVCSVGEHSARIPTFCCPATTAPTQKFTVCDVTTSQFTTSLPSSTVPGLPGNWDLSAQRSSFHQVSNSFRVPPLMVERSDSKLNILCPDDDGD